MAELERGVNPPYTWNLIPPDAADRPDILPDAGLARTHTLLRRREEADALDLDLAATLKATIEQGGVPTFRHKKRRRPAEYLLLIEKFSANDHRAGLFGRLYHDLRAAEVLIERFFFDGDPRRCYNERYPAGLDLRELRHRYPAKLEELRAVVKYLDRPEEHWDFVLPAGWEKMPGKMGVLVEEEKDGPTFPIPEMVHIPGGTFRMGSDEKDKEAFNNEKPAHTVTVKGFEIGKYPVTVQQYLHFAEETKTNYPEWMEEGSQYNVKTGSSDHYRKLGDALTGEQHPIVGISWFNAVAYCNWLSQKQQLSPAYAIKGTDVTLVTGANGYRLPTEAEWEYATRGGPKSKGFKYAGSNELDEVGWHAQNSGSKTHPVGEKKPNELDLHDMTGNVWEWSEAWFHDSYKGAPADGSAWLSPEGSSPEASHGRPGDFNKFIFYWKRDI